MVKPTILFVHGAWHTPEHMQPMRNILEAEGYPTACPVLPSVDPKPPTMDLYDDAKAIQVELSRLVEDEGRIVIVLMHSYGGVVGSEAVHCRFAKKYRESKGLQGGVIYLFCMCAFVVKLDSTVLETFGGVIPDTVMKMEDNGTCSIIDPSLRFFADLPKDEQHKWSSLLKPSSPTHLSRLTYAAYKYHPAAYLYCEEDQSLPIFMQKKMVADTGVEFKEFTCNASHSPYLSQPRTVLNVVKELTAQT